MNRFIMSFPLRLNQKPSDSFALGVSNGWPKPWLADGQGLTRQVAKLGNRTFSSAKVRHFQINGSGLQFSSAISIDIAVQVSKKNVFNQLVLIGSIAEGQESSLQEFRSVGSPKTHDRIQELFCLEVDKSATVFATTVIANTAADLNSHNGLLVSTSTNTFAFDVINSLIVSAISAERIILEEATETIFQKDLFALKSRQQLSRLTGWISTPSSDSTRIIEDIEKLRFSLRLNERSEQVSKVLSNRTRAADLSLAAFLGTLGFTSALFGNYARNSESLSLTWYEALGLATCVSILISILTFLIVRRK
jgi:hypothetical protein